MKKNHCGRPGYLVALLAILLLTTTQCGKYEYPTQFTWYGKVMEYGTLKPVPNIKLRLYPDVGSVLDSTVSDSAGNYRFHTDNYKVESHFIFPVVNRWEEYYYPGHGYTPTRFSNTETSAHLDIVLEPYGVIRHHLKNVNPHNGNDALYLTNYQYWGTEIDTVIYELNLGNRMVPIHWSVRRDTTYTNFRDSLFLPAHDTIDYEILY